MIEGVQGLIKLITESQWTIFFVFWSYMWFLMLPRQIFALVFHFFVRYGVPGPPDVWRNSTLWILYAGAYYVLRFMFAKSFYVQHRQLVDKMMYTKFRATAFVTIFNETPEVLERCLRDLKVSMCHGAKKYAIIAIIDGMDLFAKENRELGKIARKYCNVVLYTNARNKRKNIRAMMLEAHKRGLLYDISVMVDSDTVIVDTKSCALNLLQPFLDENVGGSTTTQYILDPRTAVQRVSNWMEDARIFSSMGGGSLFGEVPCLPGRMYAIRTELVFGRLDEFVNETFSYFGWMRTLCIAGDDRKFTIFVQDAGKRTLMVPGSVVLTTAPETAKETDRQWLRWGSSNNGYNIRPPWLLRFWFLLFVRIGDTTMTPAIVFMLCVQWPLSIILGDTPTMFFLAMLSATVGMMLTLLVRQWIHLLRRPEDFIYLPYFAIRVTKGQFIRFRALIQHVVLINQWGTRGGPGGASATPWVNTHPWAPKT